MKTLKEMTDIEILNELKKHRKVTLRTITTENGYEYKKFGPCKEYEELHNELLRRILK